MDPHEGPFRSPTVVIVVPITHSSRLAAKNDGVDSCGPSGGGKKGVAGL